MVKIAFDAMGGDLGYQEMVKGAVMAGGNDLEVILVGDESLLKAEIIKHNDINHISIVHASQLIEMDEEPANAYKEKRDASITVATRLVKDGLADAVISAGSTGAQMTAGIFVLGRIKNIKRPAIATYYPTANGIKILLDAGATPDCDKENLLQFAQMASIFGKSFLKMKNPTVGLLNIGSEDKKGSILYKETFKLLKEDATLNFYGNVEGRDVPKGKVDIVVCDGFVGNIVLKLMEGLSSVLLKQIRENIKKKFIYTVGGLLSKGAFREIKAQLDYTEYGGAPLLGLKGISMISHGSSDAKTMMNAIFAAKKAVDSKFNEEMIKYFEGE
ncbi:MAG: glycerol-3-phosphate acyltransferase PlsX [Fusobacteria bacterium]|nr:MAG: glycerol-3-phosphate acyltransferase PlsX [Fusobacteriota bacterium]KAF0229992.1 MAG: glycerol-3-phosphate acyltransferase [Fusobacteriota bacterium]